MKLDESISREIARAIGKPFNPDTLRPIGGGCINRAIEASDGRTSVFIKFNSKDKISMFEAERDALILIAESKTVRVPMPITCGTADKDAYLALEFIPLKPLDGRAESILGEKLAAMHRKFSDQHGWHRDNTIGATPQPNLPNHVWIKFFAEQRLAHQFKLAESNGLTIRGWRDFCEGIGRFFRGHDPVPSLLHGDLWGGNAAMTIEGEPVIFDPATYFGDRETDLAFTEMFGGFGKSFYESYRRSWPTDSGYGERKHLYNLYHVLNHFNLFGGGYGEQARSIVGKLS